MILKAGDALRIHAGVPHAAKALGKEPMRAVVVYNTGQRQFAEVEEKGEPREEPSHEDADFPPSFPRRSAAAGAGLTILPAGLSRYAANEKINVALVGVGGRGEWFVDTIPRMENVVAVCDVNDEKIAAAFQHWEEFGKT